MLQDPEEEDLTRRVYLCLQDVSAYEDRFEHLSGELHRTVSSFAFDWGSRFMTTYLSVQNRDRPLI